MIIRGGAEEDNEVKGKGSSYTTHFRPLNTRLGRWLSLDPKATVWENTYVSMGNNPILNNDILGVTIVNKTTNYFKNIPRKFHQV